MEFLKIVSKYLVYSALASGKRMYKKCPAKPLDDAEYSCSQGKGDTFCAGFAKRIIMPEKIEGKKYWLAGFKTGMRVQGVLDPMTANAVWIDDKSGGGGIVLVSVDCIGFTGYEVKLIRDALKGFCAESGCRSIEILATHTHAGIDTVGYWGPLPLTGKNKAHMKIVFDGIAGAVKEAYASRLDGFLYWGSTEVPDIQADGRTPYVFSKTLTRLRFVPEDGSKEWWILNFAAHPNSLGGGNALISADYPAFARSMIKDKTGAEVLFSVGAIAQIAMKRLDENNIESTRIAGERIGEAAISIDNDVKLLPEISLLKQEFYAAVENPVLLFIEKIGAVNSLRCSTGEGSLMNSLKTEMTFLKIGCLEMLLLPGEIFPELVYGGYLKQEETAQELPPDINPKPLAEIAGNDNLLIFGVANDMIGYIVPPNDFYLHPVQPYLKSARDRLNRNHYNETNSLGPGTANRVADVFEKIIAEIKKPQN